MNGAFSSRRESVTKANWLYRAPAPTKVIHNTGLIMKKQRTKKSKKEKVALKRAAFFLCFCLILPFFSAFSAVNRKTVAAAAKSWEKIVSYTTWFNQKDVSRCENIALAASFIDGVNLQAYGEFSFNQTVGERSAKTGFKDAKIILNGEYVKGVGGGVCQVSTTLYNAALLSGLTVSEFHPHSLAVAYVEPSRDAMVSSLSDLKIFNPYDFPVRLRLSVKDGGITVAVYGLEVRRENLLSYKIVSGILEEIPPPEPLEREGEEEGVLQYAKNGVKSEAYLEGYKFGRLASRKLLRKDVYAPVREILVKKIDVPTKKMP